MYDSVESLAYCEHISCRWVRRFPLNEDIKEGYPLRNRFFFTAISSSSMRTVADETDLLFIITSTADDLSWGTNTDDLERP